MNLTGAEIIMECLLEQQVDTVFGYPGGAVLNIYDALYRYSDRINHVLTAHEQGAAHAADGYARASGKVGVCIATSGPGATNLVTGIATAYMDSVPMVAITGNVNRDLLGLDSFQEVDITGITMPITKHNYIVKDVTELAHVIREAFQIANEGRKGPVLIDIPKDVTGARCEYTPEKPLEPEQSELPPQYWMDRALEMIEKSERPFIYAGGGVLAAEAAPELRELAERADAPVSCSLMCQGGFDQQSPRYIGMLGMHGTKTASEAIKNCDLMIAVGTRFSDRVTCNTGLFAQKFPVIQIDIDAAEFNKNVNVEVRLKGDAKEVLRALLEKLPAARHPMWMGQIACWKQQYPLTQHTDNPNGITPKEVLETLCDLTGGEAILTTEVGQHQMWAAQYYTFRHPRQLLTSGGLGTMGYGLGASLGAQVALPDKQVVNIAGDGSFHMNANELSTAAKYNIPIIELIFNNEVLGMVRQWQKLFYDNRFSQTTLDKPTNYELLAEAYGVKAMTISSREEIRPVLEAALALRQPVLINCHIDRDINVLPMVPAGASVEDPILEM
ncbi:MAG: biosynthetic-type acetolactate synthase large subunit [Oscillospiraceae bacterium]|nr:biosynthetic-type acetolactate synthase large subunit [Oscillospiraceae bacterium]